jgi:glycosyltransferase involved in cell wall biosynthesis
LRLFGLKVVMTHHGFDYQRNKWGPFARIMLRLGEYVGSRSAHQVICVAGGLKKTLVQKGADAQRIHVIYNGIEPVSPITGTDYISSLGLEPGKYIMAAARFVEEKGLHDLVQAYARLGTTNYKLVLAGNADHPTDYAQKLQADAARCPGVALPGYVEGRVLQELFSHARLCVLPSYLEGLPVTLLEAMSYQRDILSSNTGGSHELGLEAGDYFVAGDVEDLVRGLKRKLESPPRSTPYPQLEESQFNWDHIAKATAQIYDAL